jgi:hypothetical protein
MGSVLQDERKVVIITGGTVGHIASLQLTAC